MGKMKCSDKANEAYCNGHYWYIVNVYVDSYKKIKIIKIKIKIFLVKT